MRMVARIGLFLTLIVSLSACSTNKEQEALAKAQKCLDDLTTANAASGAGACFALVSEYTSAAANKMKCSIRMTEGGINESKVSDAFDILQSSSQTKEAEFMALLSLTDTSTAGMANARATQDYCKNSADPGFIYIASLVVAGTALKSAQSAIGGNPSIATVVSDCAANPSSTECTTLIEDLTPVASTMAEAYCGQASADQAVCGVVNEAIAATGNDPEKLGQALLCYMNSGSPSFDGTTCIP